MKQIKNYPNYYITETGAVFNKKLNKTVGYTAQHNHRQVYLTNENGSKAYSVSRLVAEAFLKKPKDVTYVKHINGNPQDNRVENLKWLKKGEK